MPRKPSPCILITACIERRGEEFADTSTSLSDRYPEAVVAVGGLPWVLPCLPREDKVALTPGSLIHNMAGTDTLGVNSTHHQGVNRVASPLRPTAVSPDGLVEGLELAEGAGRCLPFLLSVQFHPERMLARGPAFVQMFGGLTRAAARQCP